MRAKKLRGQYLKTNILIKRIHKLKWPPILYNNQYKNIVLPANESFINHQKLKSKYKKMIYTTLLKKLEELHSENKNNKIVLMIKEPNIWTSQLIIFLDDDYYENFYNRSYCEQSWTKSDKSLLNKYNIMTKRKIYEKSFNEEIFEEGNLIEKNTIYFYELSS